MKAVIFDFDGTLVDTMPLHYEAYRRAFAEINVELTERDFYDNVGGKAEETIPKFLRGRPSSKSIKELHARKKEVLSEMLGSVELKVLETAKLIPFLHGVVPMAIASSGARPGIDSMLRRLGWGEIFDAVLTGDDTPRGKPHPDIFLLAAEKLGATPDQCLVFEDTDDGVAAARAAGMQVFDVRRQ